jgi:hypothetical protein
MAIDERIDMTLTLLNRRHYGFSALAALVASAVVAVAVSWPSGRDNAAASAVPAWFAPIAKSYSNNPRITPKFDFASLYASYPRWFEGIARSYGYNPAITPDFDFASLYGSPDLETR